MFHGVEAMHDHPRGDSPVHAHDAAHREGKSQSRRGMHARAIASISQVDTINRAKEGLGALVEVGRAPRGFRAVRGVGGDESRPPDEASQLGAAT